MVTTIIKPTRDCNLGCKYCYTEVRDTGEKTSLETITVFLEKLKKWELDNIKIPKGAKPEEYSVYTNLIWHGGEPLLMGQEFYENIVLIQKEMETPNFKFDNSMQTNGTLLTEEYFDFLYKNKFGLGLSLDGPKHLNDLTRVYKDGSSAFDDIMRAAEIMKKKGDKPGFISVITSKNVNNLEEIADFFKEKKYGVKLNPLIPSGVALENEDLSVTPKEYGKNMSNLFRKWFSNNEKDYAKIDTFKDIIKSFIDAKPYGCDHNQTCQDTFISLGPNGDVYPCGRFDGIEDFILGNVHKNSMDEIMNSPVKEALRDRYKSLKSSCSSCNIEELCNGGCMHNAYLAGDIMKKDPFCASNKLVFGAVKEEMTKYLKSIGAKEYGNKEA
jgi:uncharacterized protein